MTRQKGENTYKSILKGNSIFGGMQMFQILISLVRGKFVAMFLGPAGMGMASLFTATADTLQRCASLGLNLAVVRDVAAARDDSDKAREVIVAARRIILLSAVAGALVCLALSSVLSTVAFGDTSNTWGMMLLAAVVLCTILWQGKMSVLQGLHHIKPLSRANIVGGLAGLLVGVPLYWLWGASGIVPAMIVYAATMLAFYSYETRRYVDTSGLRFSWAAHKHLVRSLILTGLLFMSGDLIGSVCTLSLNTFVRYTGGLADVGIWQAANSLTNQYAAVIFSAMAMDYLPRLSAAIGNGDPFAGIVNRQTEIVCLLVAPLAALLILFAPLAVHILLDESFLSAIPLIRLMAFALVFRAAMYPLGYVTMAQNNRRVFFWLEGVGCNLLTLVMNAAGFLLFGVEGIGYAMILDSLLCLFIYLAVNRRLYGFSFDRGAVRCMAAAMSSVGAALAASLIPSPLWSYAAMAVFTAAAAAVAAAGLRRRLRHK